MKLCAGGRGGEGDICGRFLNDHLCCTAHKKMTFRRFFAQIYDWKHLYLCIFLGTTFCRSAATSATLLIPKCTTRRWTLRCSNYRVANRQQCSCARSTATLSLKFENVVPDGWILFFPCYIFVIFLLLYEHVRVRVMAFFLFFGFVQPRNKHNVVPYDT